MGYTEIIDPRASCEAGFSHLYANILEGEKRDAQVYCVHPMGHSIPALTEDFMKSLDNFLRRGKDISFRIFLFEVQIFSRNREYMMPVMRSVYNNCKRKCCLVQFFFKEGCRRIKHIVQIED